MDTIEVSLGDNPELGVMRIHTTVPNIGGRLKALDPDAVIFDWDAPHTEFVLPFLREQPGVPLLGLDVTRSEVVAVCSQRYLALTVDDLARVVKGHASAEPSALERDLGLALDQYGREIVQ
jgi:hypothetical protein